MKCAGYRCVKPKQTVATESEVPVFSSAEQAEAILAAFIAEWPEQQRADAERFAEPISPPPGEQPPWRLGAFGSPLRRPVALRGETSGRI
jgi:hypothetical protein